MGILKSLTENLKDVTIRSNYLLKHLLNEKETYLHESGWIRSFREKKPVDAKGFPIPWLSLPSVRFLGPRLNPNLTLFEYGSGNSTIYFAGRVKKVEAVESDPSWYEHIKSKLPENAQIHFISLENGDNYVQAATASGLKYDIIIVDGRSRNACVQASASALSEEGIVILDDSDRPRYQESDQHMLTQGFKSLEFWGMAAGSTRTKCTTIYYRTRNCLNI